MKRCPQCGAYINDESLLFCRVDGARLVDDTADFTDSRTLTLPPDAPVAAAPVNDGYASAPAPATIAINPPIVTILTSRLFKRYRKAIRVAGLAIITSTFAVSAYYYSVAHRGPAAISSLAVLPLFNVNADQQLDYLSDGLTEMLIYNLSRLPILNVKARSSVFRYKGKDVTPRTVGSELNVEAILNGRIVSHGDLLTLSLELADARTENIIWSEQYSRKLTDLVSLQNEVALDVFNKLRVKLAGADEQKLTKKYTTNEEAYQLYLKGRMYWNRRTLRDLERAVDYFNQAIDLDPGYAVAYAGLADAYAVLPVYRDQPMSQSMGPARETAIKALSLDSDLAEPHATLGRVLTHQYDFDAAELEYKRSIELAPNYATAHQWYGLLLIYQARYEESLAELRRAFELEPISPIINTAYADGFYYARRYDEAIAQAKKTIELDGQFPTAYRNLGKYYQQKGNYAEAAESYAVYRTLIGDSQSAALIRESFAKGGWRACLQAMTAKEQLSKLSRYEVVAFFVALGEKEKALEELNKSYETFGPPLLKIDPLLDPLRGDPRFSDIIHRAGLS